MPLPDKLRLFAVAAPGLETVVEAEVAALPGVEAVERVGGGVEFTGGHEVVLRANLQLRVATRVWMRLGEMRARDFAPLRDAMARLPWQAVLVPERPLAITAATSKCRLYHTGALAERLALAIQDATGREPTLAPKQTPDAEDSEANPLVNRVLLRGENDHFTVSVDSSGALLHRRGFRVETGRAPLRETLAAGILRLCGYDGTEALADPMCGAGTFLIEAAGIATGQPPGASRSFSCEAWPGLRPGPRAKAALLVPRFPVVGADRSERAVAVALRNVERAGLSGSVTVAVGELGLLTPPAAAGLLVANPPYGHRIGNRESVQRVYQSLGTLLRGPYRGWRAGVLVPSPDQGLVRALGLRARATHDLVNGGLRVKLMIFDPRG